MLPPLDDVKILTDTVRDNGTMTYTLPDGHAITADIGDEEPTGPTLIAWCENVREIVLSRQQSKEEVKVEAKEEISPTVDVLSPIEYAKAQVRAMAVRHDSIARELKERMDQVDQLAIDLEETEVMGKQWQDILDSLTETDAELQLRKKRET